MRFEFSEDTKALYEGARELLERGVHPRPRPRGLGLPDGALARAVEAARRAGPRSGSPCPRSTAAWGWARSTSC